MTSARQCKEFSADYAGLAMQANISLQRATILAAISRGFTTLSLLMERYEEILKEERNEDATMPVEDRHFMPRRV